MRKTVLTFLLAVAATGLFAQLQWELGGSFNVTNYQGDLVKERFNVFQDGQLSFGLSARYNFNYILSARAQLLFGNLKGSDFNYEDRRQRGYRFKTGFTELIFLGEWEIFGEKRYLSGSGYARFPSPYVLVGAGLVFTDPNPDFSDSNGGANSQFIPDDINAEYLRTRFVLPFGGGVKYDLSENWSLAAEVILRTPFTDYLDGISLSAGPDNGDWYYTVGVTLFHRLEGTEKK
jgi:opacity protein-like surface antigen